MPISTHFPTCHRRPKAQSIWTYTLLKHVVYKTLGSEKKGWCVMQGCKKKDCCAMWGTEKIASL
jgi:hypothetical protein